MQDWFETIQRIRSLDDRAALQLERDGFAVIPDVFAPDRLRELTDAHDAAVASATEPDKRVGNTSTRVRDFVNRGAAFDDVYLFAPLLHACCRVIGRPFKLSSFQSRTVHAQASAQDLHVDVQRESADWPLLGFILMIDEFRKDNGATRFVAGSHRRASAPSGNEEQTAACGSAGSLLIFNGSTWHGHGASTSGNARRSLQGAFIPREGKSGVDFAARMDTETRERLSPLAKHLLAV